MIVPRRAVINNMKTMKFSPRELNNWQLRGPQVPDTVEPKEIFVNEVCVQIKNV